MSLLSEQPTAPAAGAPPYGGRLVHRVVPEAERQEALRRARDLRPVPIDAQAAADLELIAVGAYSPLTGFMNRDDYESVVERMRLETGLTWTLPITLTVDAGRAREIPVGETVCLIGPDGGPLATMVVEDRFRFNKEREALYVYGTQDPAHPGVRALYRRGDAALGGPIRLLRRPPSPHRERILDPADVREEIRRRGWRTVVGFQTRNPLHRAHEYLLKCALELYDGLLLHPLVGPTKDDDVPAEVRIQTYDAILRAYYPPERVMLALFPAPMRYAGPREAVFHAICRQNYGCTHFIVGRNHAGVGDFYGPYEARALLERLAPGALGITPLFFEHAFFCSACGGMATTRTCPHREDQRVVLSGSEVRRRLQELRPLPPEFSRPEVAVILLEHARRARSQGATSPPAAPRASGDPRGSDADAASGAPAATGRSGEPRGSGGVAGGGGAGGDGRGEGSAESEGERSADGEGEGEGERERSADGGGEGEGEGERERSADGEGGGEGEPERPAGPSRTSAPS